MIFVWVEEDDKDSQIFAIWVHSQFIERDNDVQSNQIFAFLYTSESLVYQEQKIVISFDQSIELSVVNAETQTFVFLFSKQDERDVWCEAEENELFVKCYFSIWVEVKLFCFVIVLWLESRTIDFWLEMKIENRRKSIRISITRLILFIHVFSRIIWC